jgi:hypothetical protein
LILKIFSWDQFKGKDLIYTLGGALANNQRMVSKATELGTKNQKITMFRRNMSKHMSDLGMLGQMPMITINGGLDPVPEIVSPMNSP